MADSGNRHDEPLLYGADGKPLIRGQTLHKAVAPTTPGTKTPTPVNKPKRTSLFRLLLAAALAIATLLGYVVVIPRMTVTASDPVNTDDPFSSLITITNTGYIPLDEVKPIFAIREISWGDPGNPMHLEADTGSYDMRFVDPSRTPIRLGIDDKFTYDLNSQFQGPLNLVRAQVAIVVEYKIPLVRLKRKKLFPFTAARKSDSSSSRDSQGKFYWYPQAPPN